ncbi:MAG: VOC family protein [Thiohalobacterales bacterium]|nr:VOC family protein [Thiohalobacterales bacterium]
MTGVSGLDHVSILVNDTGRALDFYHGILGLPVNAERPDLGFPGAWLDVGPGQQIHLLELPADTCIDRPSVHGGRDRHIALRVDDLDSVVGTLAEAGIDYTLSRSGRRALFCRDPDGNAVELVESRSG